MTQKNKRKVVRDILLNPRFLQLKYISMAIDYRFDRDRKEDRYSHSVEVANCCEIINDSLEEKHGFLIDHKNTAYIVGLLHDIGHTAFGHEGEKTLDKVIRTIREDLRFFGNSNNYAVIEKSRLLNGVESEEDKDYILASLAKHPNELYKGEQDYIFEKISTAVKEDKEYLEANGLNTNKMEKTLQCQIMDVADENCYIISDLIDSLNIISVKKMAKIMRKELPSSIAEEIISSMYGSKQDFVNKMQEYFYAFSDNFILIDGVLTPEDKEIEKIRQTFAKINRKYVIKDSRVATIRKKNEKILLTVFGYFLLNENDKNIPSKFYKKELKKVSSEKERVRIIRDMLGSLTDKGIKKIYYKIKGE